MIQVTPTAVVKWIGAGLLKAYATPGGHHRIRVPDLLAFLRQHGMYIPAELQPAKQRVLLIDDDSKQLAILRRELKLLGELDLLTTNSATDGLLLIGLHRPHMVIMKYAMAELDGLALLAKLQAHPETRSIAVVLLSSGGVARLRRKGLPLGASAVLSLPMRAAQLPKLTTA